MSDETGSPMMRVLLRLAGPIGTIIGVWLALKLLTLGAR